MERTMTLEDTLDESAEAKAEALFDRGMTKNLHDDVEGEIADYTQIIEMPDAPAEPKANALFYRGMLKRWRDAEGAKADLMPMIEMSDAPIVFNHTTRTVCADECQLVDA